MRLPDVARQVLAAVLAGAAFAGLYLGLGLVAWLAALLALLAFAAVLVLVPRKPPPEEVRVAGRFSEADLQAALAALRQAALVIDAACEGRDGPLADRARAISAKLGQLGALLRESPGEYASLRSFLVNLMPPMATSVADAVARGGAHAEIAQGTDLAAHLDTFAASLDRLLSRRVLARLSETEIEMKVIATQLSRQV